MTALAKKLKTLPQKPGVYLFKDSAGEVLYVGKAKSLHSRVPAYFRKGGDGREKMFIMAPQIADLDYIVVSSEIESLMLENTLIKKYQPRFNVSLRDDKNYQFIKIDYEMEIPQVYPVRKIDDTGSAKYFGPYTSALAVKNTIKLLKRVFHLCTNKKLGGKSCFQYHLKRCPGVCIGQSNLHQYRQIFTQIEQFLKNKQADIVRDLKEQMQTVAKKRQFEKAAMLRDKIRALQNIWEKQKVVSTKKEDHDYLGLYATAKEAIINLLIVREGRLTDQRQFKLRHPGSPAAEILERFILQYYSETSNLPKQIFVPEWLGGQNTIEKFFKFKITKPIRGKKFQLLKLAHENAKHSHERELASFEKNIKNTLEGLKNLLKLTALPHRIEGFDISNIQGTHPVGSVVVFTDGHPDKSQYRRFKIRLKATPDDVGMMREMIERRFAHGSLPSLRAKRSNLESRGIAAPATRVGARNDKETWPLPDLIIIDGGKAQLNTAVKVLKAKSYNLTPIIGLAKRLEEIYVPDKNLPLRLPENSPVLHLLQRIRDEAHRFALGYHRKRRAQAEVRSRLDEIPGIGPKTKKKLLQKFGSINEIKKAPLEALTKVIGTAKAKIVKE